MSHGGGGGYGGGNGSADGFAGVTGVLQGSSHATAALAAKGGLPGADSVVDHGLHVPEGTVCYACDTVIHAKDWTRRGRLGTRHDTCP